MILLLAVLDRLLTTVLRNGFSMCVIGHWKTNRLDVEYVVIAIHTYGLVPLSS